MNNGPVSISGTTSADCDLHKGTGAGFARLLVGPKAARASRPGHRLTHGGPPMERRAYRLALAVAVALLPVTIALAQREPPPPLPPALKPGAPPRTPGEESRREP